MERLFAFHTAGLQGGTHGMDPPGPVRPDAAFRNQFLAHYFELFPGQIPLTEQKETDFLYDTYRKSVFLLSIMRRLRL